MSTGCSISALLHVPESTEVARGLLDRSVVIELGHLEGGALPGELAVSAITMAELAAGPHAANDGDERGRRQELLQRVEATFDPLPFDANAARAYGRLYAAVAGGGRKARGERALDLLIASVALANQLPLYTLNPRDFQFLDDLVDVVPVAKRPER
jgi:predicted nucleic acid-binding protein